MTERLFDLLQSHTVVVTVAIAAFVVLTLLELALFFVQRVAHIWSEAARIFTRRAARR